MSRGSVYLIGSLRNPEVPRVAAMLRALGFDVFDDWYAAGPEADDRWRDYEKARLHSLPQALEGRAAQHVFNFDRTNLERCDYAVLLMPAGKSGHIELGYFTGFRAREGKRARSFIVFDTVPDRYDVMHAFADGGAFLNVDEFLDHMNGLSNV